MRFGWRNLAAVGVILLAGCGATTASAAVNAKAVPTLGVRTGTFFNGVGFGKVAPREVFNGGDPTGLVTSITWHDWGKAQAVGTGRGFYVAPNQAVAAGKAEPVRIVAFDLGRCHGVRAYLRYKWWLPTHGGTMRAAFANHACL